MRGRVLRHDTDTMPRGVLTPRHADRWAWRPWIAPADCSHVARAFYLGTPELLTKLCGGCGTVLADELPRCPATNKKANRQCRRPVRTDLGYALCAAHRRERGCGDDL